MSFSTVSSFRPVLRPHPLAKSKEVSEASEGKGFIPPSMDIALAKGMQDAIARYPEMSITSSSEDWISEAKTFKGVEYMSASMLVATFVLMDYVVRSDTPTEEQVVSSYDRVMSPYIDMTLPPDEQDDQRTRQLADLWRYVKRVVALRRR
jgi:hypothetical protein